MLSSGFTLIGSDIKLNSPSSLIGQALTEILQHPERARDALRVLLHLVRADGEFGQDASENQPGQHEMGVARYNCSVSGGGGDGEMTPQDLGWISGMRPWLAVRPQQPQPTSLPESFPGFRKGLIVPLASPCQ